MSSPRRDQFGFVIKPGTEGQEETTPRRKGGKRTWPAFLKKIGNDPTKIERSKHVKELIRKEGVPTEIRGKVWLAITKAREHSSLMQYPDILATFDGMESVHTSQIEKDLRRTFPDNAMFESEEGINVLRRVLVAYSWLNPEIGYCQSMNFICALYLLFMDEEDAFWLLKATMEEILPAGYYTQGMLGVRSDNSVLQQLLNQKLPKVSQHLAKHEVVLDGLTTGWFMCLFVNILPLQATLRVFDSLFLEGSKILFRVGLALFKYHEKAILKETSFEGLYNYINHMAENTVESSRLMDESFNKEWMGSMPANKINSMRLTQWQLLQRSLIEESGKREDAIQILDIRDVAEEAAAKKAKGKGKMKRSNSNSDLKKKARTQNVRVLGRSESSTSITNQSAAKSRPLGLAAQTVQKPQPLAGARPRNPARVRQRANTSNAAKPGAASAKAEASPPPHATASRPPKSPAPPPPTHAPARPDKKPAGERRAADKRAPAPPSPSPSPSPSSPSPSPSPLPSPSPSPSPSPTGGGAGPPPTTVAPPRPKRQAGAPTGGQGAPGTAGDARTQQLIDSRFSARLRPFSILVSSPGSLPEILPPIPRRERPPAKGPPLQRPHGTPTAAKAAARRAGPSSTTPPVPDRTGRPDSRRTAQQPRRPQQSKSRAVPARPARVEEAVRDAKIARVATPPSTQGSPLARYRPPPSARATVKAKAASGQGQGQGPPRNAPPSPPPQRRAVAELAPPTSRRSPPES